MPTLKEYFERDNNHLFCLNKELIVGNTDGTQIKISGRLMIDFESGTKFPIVFFDNNIGNLKSLLKLFLGNIEPLINLENKGATLPSKGVKNRTAYTIYNPGDGTIRVTHEGFGDGSTDLSTLKFSNRMIFYLNEDPNKYSKNEILQLAKSKGVSLTIRDNSYEMERNKYEIPIAFISHASLDKEIARQIADEMKKSGKVWYDEFSLKVGDSLKDSIEKGLKECKKCIILLTPNFLNKGGWTKLEYDSIFTREMIEEKNLILPVWHNIDPKDIYKYSPILADRVAVNWNLGVKEVCKKLLQSIDSE